MVEVVRNQPIVLVAAAMALALLAAACGRDEQLPDTSFSVRMLTIHTISGRWERAAERGLGRIAAELEADVARVRVDDPTGERQALAEQGRAGADLVFCVGGFSESALYSVATEFANTVFVQLPGDARAANVAGIRFLPEEVGYLAGAVAGVLAPDGRVGLLHGSGQPWLELLEEGYVAGFKSRWRRTQVEAADGAEGVWRLSSAGVRMSSPPKAVMIFFLSSLMFSGMMMITRYPFCTPTSVKPIPVFPEVASTMVLPGFNSPFFSASSTI